MSKYNVLKLWKKRYGEAEDVWDYAGRLMKRSACGNPRSSFEPTIDHIRPLSKGGQDIEANIEICHYTPNEEKGDDFPHWATNGQRFHAEKSAGVPGGYEIVKEGEM